MGSLGSPPMVPPSAPPPPPIRPTPTRSTKRVPDHQRRRAAVSCDHCKQRRAKCMRASPQEPCSNCIGNRIKCQSTLPRKQRVYGSVESLSLRYRALEALVRGMLQPEETGQQQNGLDSAMSDALPPPPPPGPSASALDLDALYQAAADRGIPMPPREDMTPASEIFAANTGNHTGPTATIVSTPLSPPTHAPSHEAMMLPSSTGPAPGSRPGSMSLPHGTSTAWLSLPPPMMPPQAPAIEEKLIPTPYGVAHYVGPSSSFRFVTSIRALVAQCGNSIGGDEEEASGHGGATGENGGGPGGHGGHRGPPLSVGGEADDSASVVAQTPSAIRDDFVGLRTSKALEPQESTGDEDEDEDEEDGEEDDDAHDDDDAGRDAMDGVVGSNSLVLNGGESRQSPMHRRTPEQQQQLPHRHDHRPHSLHHHYYYHHHPSHHHHHGHLSSQAGSHSAAPSSSASRRSRSEYGDATVATTFLPPRETADVFVRVFFDRVHPNYPVFHRGAFLLRYEALWRQQRGEDGAADPGGTGGGAAHVPDTVGWNCCLAMVFAFGAQALEGHDRARGGGRAGALQRRYLHVVRNSLGRLAGTTSLANVQALLLLQLYEHNAGQRNAAWTFLGCASRMAVALGMHRDGVAMTGLAPIAACMGHPGRPADSNQAAQTAGGASSHAHAVATSPLSAEREARRRVWWTLYTFERNLCIMLGRPSTLDEAEIAVALPADNDNGEDDRVASAAAAAAAADLPPPGLSASTVRLVRASWRIKQLVYPAQLAPAPGGEADVAATARHLLAELDAWRASLPAHLQQPDGPALVPQHRRAVLLLHVQFQYARALATRPYVLERATTALSRLSTTTTAADTKLSPANHLLPTTGARPHDVHALADVGLDAAEKSLDYLARLGRADLLDGVAWMDVYYVYHSVLVLCLDLLGRSAADKAGHHGGSSSSSSSTVKGSSTSVPATTASADARRRAAVRSMLQMVDGIPLAGTFRILIQVARQLAAIVGALDGLPGLFADHETKSNRSSVSHAGSSSNNNNNPGRKNSSVVNTTDQTMHSTAATSNSGGPFQSVPVTATTTAATIASAQPVPAPAGQQTPSTDLFYQHQHQQQQHQQQQQQNQLQQIQDFTGGDWFADLSASFWGPFDTTGAATVGAAASAAAAAAAATSSYQQAFFSPTSLPFGSTPDTTTFGEETYMTETGSVFSQQHNQHSQHNQETQPNQQTQQTQQQHQGHILRAGSRSGGGNNSSNGMVTPSYSSHSTGSGVGRNGSQLPPPPQQQHDHHHAPHPQPQQHVEGSGWAVQAWRELNTRYT